MAMQELAKEIRDEVKATKTRATLDGRNEKQRERYALKKTEAGQEEGPLKSPKRQKRGGSEPPRVIEAVAPQRRLRGQSVKAGARQLLDLAGPGGEPDPDYLMRNLHPAALQSTGDAL